MPLLFTTPWPTLHNSPALAAFGNYNTSQLRSCYGDLMEPTNSGPRNVFPLPLRQSQGEPSGAVPASGVLDRPGSTMPVFGIVSVDDIADNPYQTREITSDAELEELSKSIQSHGILQPILLRTHSDAAGMARYQLVAGERRLRAAKLAGWREVPALIQTVEEQTAAELAVIENAQRLDLNPIEEALAYRQLVGRFGLTHQDVAKVVGKSRAVISNALRLLNLDERVIDLLKSGDLSAGHGRLLLTVENTDQQYKLARRIVSNGLSVRAVERMLEGSAEEGESEDSAEMERLKMLADRQQEKVREYLNVEQVQLRFDAQGRRRLQVVFESDASWKRFISKIR